MPKEFTGFLTIRSQSGDVYINKLSNYCMVDVTAVSGDFLLAHSTLKRVQADLKSGDIVISNTSANVFHVNGHSGMLDSNDVNAKEEISYHTISGNMELENINTKNFFVDTKSGKKTNWHSSGIALILKNEKYMGDALLQKTYTVDFLTKKRVKNNGIMPQYYVENDHAAIIPRSVFMQVQNLMNRWPPQISIN